MTEESNSHPLPDRAGDHAGSDEFSEMTLRVGGELRRPAPEDAVTLLKERRARQTRHRIMAAGGAVAVLLVAILGVVRLTRDPEQLAADESQSPPATTIATTLTAAATTSTGAATTTTVTALSPEIQWALDYTGGMGGTASGEPVRIGVRTSGDVGARLGVDAAVALINDQLGGLGGRPVEVVECASIGNEAECASQFATDDSIIAVIGGDSPPAEFFGGMGTSRPMLLTFAGDPSLVDGMTVDEIPGFVLRSDGSLNALAPVEFAIERLDPPAASVLYVGVFADLLVPELARLYPDVRFDGVESVVTDEMGDGTVEAVAGALSAADVASFDAVVVVDIGQSKCFNISGALAQLGLDPVVIALENCVLNSAVADSVASRGLAGEAPDGWYIASTGTVSDEVDTGWPAFRAALGAQGAEDLPIGETIAHDFFSTLLVMAKLINEVGGPDAATVPVLREAIRTFSGPAPMQPGELRCGATNFPGTFQSPYSCATALDIYQYVDGRWVPIANANTGGPVVAS